MWDEAEGGGEGVKGRGEGGVRRRSRREGEVREEGGGWWRGRGGGGGGEWGTREGSREDGGKETAGEEERGVRGARWRNRGKEGVRRQWGRGVEKERGDEMEQAGGGVRERSGRRTEMVRRRIGRVSGREEERREGGRSGDEEASGLHGEGERRAGTERGKGGGPGKSQGERRGGEGRAGTADAGERRGEGVEEGEGKGEEDGGEGSYGGGEAEGEGGARGRWREKEVGVKEERGSASRKGTEGGGSDGAEARRRGKVRQKGEGGKQVLGARAVGGEIPQRGRVCVEESERGRKRRDGEERWLGGVTAVGEEGRGRRRRDGGETEGKTGGRESSEGEEPERGECQWKGEGGEGKGRGGGGEGRDEGEESKGRGVRREVGEGRGTSGSVDVREGAERWGGERKRKGGGRTDGVRRCGGGRGAQESVGSVEKGEGVGGPRGRGREAKVEEGVRKEGREVRGGRRKAGRRGWSGEKGGNGAKEETGGRSGRRGGTGRWRVGREVGSRVWGRVRDAGVVEEVRGERSKRGKSGEEKVESGERGAKGMRGRKGGETQVWRVETRRGMKKGDGSGVEGEEGAGGRAQEGSEGDERKGKRGRKRGAEASGATGGREGGSGAERKTRRMSARRQECERESRAGQGGVNEGTEVVVEVEWVGVGGQADGRGEEEGDEVRKGEGGSKAVGAAEGSREAATETRGRRDEESDVFSGRSRERSVWCEKAPGSNSKIGLGFEIKSNDEVLSYEEEMNFSVFKCSKEDSIGKPSYSRFTKTNDFKGVPPPLSGDYTPIPQEEIDDTLYVYGKKGPQTPEISVSDESTFCPFIADFSNESLETHRASWILQLVSEQHSNKEAHTVNRKNWNDRMERELGEGYSFTKKKCFVCGSLSHLIKDCDYYEKKMAREAEVKRVVNTGNGVAKPVWTNASRINHANQFVPRSVQLNAGRPKFNSVRPHINTGRTNINSVRPKVNSVSPKVNSVSPKVNTVRPKQPVPNKTSNSSSPKRPQMNQMNQRRDFSKSYSSVRRPFAKTTAQMSHFNAVVGNWGSAVKTSASYNWRNNRPNFNYNSGPTFIRTEHPLKNMVDRGIFDSGCSGHMTGNKDQLEDFEEFNGGSVTFGGSKGYISGKGRIRVGNLDFDSVSFVKELGHFNLFSISQICDKQHKVLFTETECLVVSSDFKMPDENQILLKVPRHHNMYSFDMKTPSPAKGFACLIAKATSDESKLWHRRLGHINFKNLNKLVKGNLVRGLPSKVFKNDHTCVACHKGKQHRASCKAKLERLITVFFLASKDETSDILQTFIRQIENQLSHRVKIIRSDNGTEFKNRDMLEFCGNKGIKQEYSTARTPQQNGVAERMNRTLIEAARTMLADSLLPTTFWAEAVSTACYIFNRVRVTKPQNKTPYELLFGHKPIISYIRPFGCHVTILDTLSVLGKFDGKSDEGFLVGYSLNSKAYRVYNLVTKRVEVNLHVNFLEDKPNVKGVGYRWMFDIDYLTDSMNYIPVSLENQANPHAGASEVTNSAGTPTSIASEEKDEEVELIVVPSAVKIPEEKDESRTSSTNSKKEETLTEPQKEKKDSSTDSLEDNPKIQAFRRELEEIALKHLGTVPENNTTSTPSVNTETRSKVQTNQSSGSSQSDSKASKKQCTKNQRHSIQEELLQFKLQQVWVLVDLPHGMKVVTNGPTEINEIKECVPVARIELSGCCNLLCVGKLLLAARIVSGFNEMRGRYQSYVHGFIIAIEADRVSIWLWSCCLVGLVDAARKDPKVVRIGSQQVCRTWLIAGVVVKSVELSLKIIDLSVVLDRMTRWNNSRSLESH
ncbi:putative ribonuclease H-like domain-containing protein [Tanacetum coccineum]